MKSFSIAALGRATLLASTVLAAPHVASAAEQLPSGLFITPTAPAGSFQQYLNPGLAAYPNFIAGQAVREALSPDGKTLAIICAGQNSLVDPTGKVDAGASTQFIFIYDVSGANRQKPALTQVIQQTNAHVGLVWSLDGATLYAAGGNDDAVYAYTKTTGTWAQAAKIALGHNKKGLGLFGVQPNAGGLAISADGKSLVVVNNYNDSISVIDTATNTVRYEHDLRPFSASNEGTAAVPGGEYPFAVVMKGNVAYVSSDRDREVVVVDVSSPTAGQFIGRIKLDGNALGMTLSADGSTLYVAQDNADQIAVISTANNTVVAKIDARAPAGVLRGVPQSGAAPFAVRLSPDGNTLLAVNAGANAIAMINTRTNKVMGLIPTAYEPHDAVYSADGKILYIINGKSNTGPNPSHLTGATTAFTSIQYPGGNAAAALASATSNQYQFQLERASLVSTLVPTRAALTALTAQVAQNNGYAAAPVPADKAAMAFLRKNIKHVIYIVKENRTFDQVLGDLTNGANVDPSLTVFGAGLTPNHHKLATNFVTLDNFLDPGDGSMDGWSWSLQGRVTNVEALTQQINYAFVNRGLSYESEGGNRNVPVGLDTLTARDAATGNAVSTQGAGLAGGAANLLPGTANHASSDAAFGYQQGYIFNAALQAGKTVRNYGFLVNNIGATKDSSNNPITNAGAAGVQQVAAVNPDLLDKTDLFFRGYDQNVADIWRYNEWKREFDQYAAAGSLPNFSMVRFSHDHMGSFGSALGGFNTPETQQADNDLAVGKLVETIANSQFANDTVIFIIEDDCQDGPDHVDSHRATTYVAGAFVKKGAVVKTRYNQVNVLRTIEDIFGAPHLNLNTAFARPMTDVFDLSPANRSWTFSAAASTVLKTTSLFADVKAGKADGLRFAEGPDLLSTHDAAYWENATKGFNFAEADMAPPRLFNQVLWQGLKGDVAAKATGVAGPQVAGGGDADGDGDDD